MSQSQNFMSALESEIRAKYKARIQSQPNIQDLGWRFLYSPQRVLDGAKVAFLGLNPGGSVDNKQHPAFSCEKGSAYKRINENWGTSAGLQDQVISLFKRLGVDADDVLAGNLIPFRTPDEKALIDKAEAIAFGKSLWARAFERAQPRLIISMGNTANTAISELLGVSSQKNYLVAWGNMTAKRGNFQKFQGGIWIGLPHLSRFSIMERAASKAALDELFAGLSF